MSKVVPIARAAAPSKALGTLFTKAGIVKGVETSIVLGKGADHLQVIAQLALDGLNDETVPERRLVLEAIKTACKRTLALAVQARPGGAQ